VKQERAAAKDRFEHEARMKDLDAKIMAQEFSARTQIASIEGESKIETAAYEAFAKSFNEPAMYSEKVKPSRWQAWVLIGLDGLRGSIRPILTLYLCAITTKMYFDAYFTLKAVASLPIPVESLLIFLNKIADAVIYLTTTCVLWWFGSRPPKK
jgi:hypothetical protein